jgi:hypothetical protein
MENKEGNSRSGRRSNVVGPDRIARTLSELYMMTNATANWKGPRHLHYDFYDARLRSFMNGPRYTSPTPHYPRLRRLLLSRYDIQ